MTEIVRFVVPTATVAVSCVSESTLNDVALVPLNFTAVAPVRLVPVIVTLAPIAPEVGVKLDTVGAGITVKVPLDVAVPAAVVTLTVPLVVPEATAAVI